MLRWMIVIFLALVVLSWLSPWLNKLGFGQLPGDLLGELVVARIGRHARAAEDRHGRPDRGQALGRLDEL